MLSRLAVRTVARIPQQGRCASSAPGETRRDLAPFLARRGNEASAFTRGGMRQKPDEDGAIRGRSAAPEANVVSPETSTQGDLAYPSAEAR